MNTTAADLLAVLNNGQTFIRLPYQGASHLLPVPIRDDVLLGDLLGIDEQKNAVLTNIDRFLTGLPYNHILLWGARGTGKSSLVRAALHHFAPRGLKALQLSCDDLEDLPFLLWTLGQSDDFFMVFIDDLSFSADDRRYRALKAALDGALSGIAANIVLCVTSNRRHLLNEFHHDERALHPDEDSEEQISLAERFGLRLSFHPLTQGQYLVAVAHWLGVATLSEETRKKALQFALARGSRSARVAVQFCRQHVELS